VRGNAAALLAAGLLAALLWGAHPVLAAAPLLVVGLPAALMLGATIRHGDPYDVSHKYPARELPQASAGAPPRWRRGSSLTPRPASPASPRNVIPHD